MKHRIFFALNIPEKTKEELIEIRNNIIIDSNKYKWESKDKLHLTLKFIGEVEEDILNKILDIKNLFGNFNSFKCSINKFGFFYKNKEARILWANIQAIQLDEIVKHLEDELFKLSIQKENRPFVPHLTLLRIKNKINQAPPQFGQDFIKAFENYEFKPIEFIASEISLIESKLFPYGSIYNEIKKYNLGETK